MTDHIHEELTYKFTLECGKSAIVDKGCRCFFEKLMKTGIECPECDGIKKVVKFIPVLEGSEIWKELQTLKGVSVK